MVRKKDYKDFQNLLSQKVLTVLRFESVWTESEMLEVVDLFVNNIFFSIQTILEDIKVRLWQNIIQQKLMILV
jgi:hypothetical protein